MMMKFLAENFYYLNINSDVLKHLNLIHNQRTHIKGSKALTISGKEKEKFSNSIYEKVIAARNGQLLIGQNSLYAINKQ